MTTKVVIIVEDGNIQAVVASQTDVELVVIDLDLDVPMIHTHSASLPDLGQTIDDFIAEYDPTPTESENA